VYDTLWDELKRRWARNRFGTYIRKWPLDAHFRQLKADGGAGTRAATSEEGVGRRHRRGDDAR
jgi:hypothetical protein